jgi:hypothetical protein
VGHGGDGEMGSEEKLENGGLSIDAIRSIGYLQGEVSTKINPI